MTAVDARVEQERFLRLLWAPGDVGELRVIHRGRYKRTDAGYFDDPGALAEAVAKYDGKADVYITLNPVKPALMARYDGIAEGASTTTSDGDILRRRWLPLDIDPARPAGISSTKEELAAAIDLAKEISIATDEAGWPEPLFCMSGNGAYLLYRVDLPNTPESTALVKAVLEELSRRHNTEAVHIDPTVHNAARIIGLVGAMKIKGANTTERPHRRSQIVYAPDEQGIVSEEQLRALLPRAQELQEHRQRPSSAGSSSTPDLAWMLDQLGIDYRDSGADATGVTRYNLKSCPFCDMESGGYRCGVGQASSGAYSGHCFSYPDRHWQDFKRALGLERFFASGTASKQQSSNGDRSAGEQVEVRPVLTRVVDVEREEVDWRWQDRLPLGKLTVVSGDPGDGKSWLSLAITTAITLGLEIGGTKKLFKPANVLLMSAEDGAADTIRPRLEDMGADLDRAITWDATRDADGKERWPSLVDDLIHLESILASGTYQLVVIDPVNAYLRGIDGHRDIDLRSVLGPLAKLAERYHVAVIIIRHLTKSSRDRAIYRGAGGIGYTGAGRVEWLVGRNPDDLQERVVAVIKNNLAPEATNIAFEIVDGLFKWRGETDVTKEQMLAPDRQEIAQRPRDAAVEFLRELLKDGEAVPADDVYAAAEDGGMSKRTIKRAKEELPIWTFRRGETGKRGAGTWFWRLRVPHSHMKESGTLNPETGSFESEAGPNGAKPTEAGGTLNPDVAVEREEFDL